MFFLVFVTYAFHVSMNEKQEEAFSESLEAMKRVERESKLARELLQYGGYGREVIDYDWVKEVVERLELAKSIINSVISGVAESVTQIIYEYVDDYFDFNYLMYTYSYITYDTTYGDYETYETYETT